MNKLFTILLTISYFTIKAQIVEIPVNFETDPVTNHNGADDPSLWVHPTNRDLSFFLGTNKKVTGGQLDVYDLLGKRIAVETPGKAINNVDVRYNFPFNGELIDIVTANNVTDKTIEIWKINPNDQSLTNISGNNSTGLSDLYGYKMYHNVCTDKFYGFTSLRNSGSGTVYQYELFDNDNGGVDISLVRTINNISTLVEGITADDVLGHLYIGEEDVAIWKYGANPEDDLSRVKMDSVSGPNLAADIEGLTIYYSNDSTGYIIASSQEDDTFAVYEREKNNTYLGSFRLVFGGEDGVEYGDGVEVMSYPMGGYFNTGALIAHDYTNTSPSAFSNYKMAPWGDIANAMGLRIDTTYSPREMTVPQAKVLSSKDTICTNLFETANLTIDSTHYELISWSTGAKTSSIPITEPGKYFATVYNNCKGTIQTDTITVVGDICTSIQETEQTIQWTIAPNPANNQITISQNLNHSITMQLLDLSGKLLLTQAINGGSNTISLTTIANGSYLVKLLDKHTLLGTKLVVKASN
jgi:3-phytase